MNGYDDEMIDAMAAAQESGDCRPDDEPEPEPGECPFCGGYIRPMPWFFHCNGCGCNWTTLGDIKFDRRNGRGQTTAPPPEGRIDEHLAAVDAAELWAGEPPF